MRRTTFETCLTLTIVLMCACPPHRSLAGTDLVSEGRDYAGLQDILAALQTGCAVLQTIRCAITVCNG